MSMQGKDDLEDLVGEWADAVSDTASEDVDDLDSLADAWATKNGTRDLSKITKLPPPPAPDEPITLPQRPDPVLLAPLPDGDFSAAAKKGDTRYASPIEIATPKPIRLPAQKITRQSAPPVVPPAQAKPPARAPMDAH